MQVEPEVVKVGLGDRAYPIVIASDLIDQAGSLILEALGRTARIVVVADKAMITHGHLKRLQASLQACDIAFSNIEISGGEQAKSFERLEHVLESMLGLGVDRKAAVIAFGGGVIGDLAGFASSILLRGVDLIQIPTTLLAQVDSSVGGKTGINSGKHGKNLIGTFYQPRLVLIDTAVLDTLPPRELRAGYAETLKYGCILDADMFRWLEANGAALLAGDQQLRAKAIRRSVEIKAAVVADDERELSGRRALLNFGHTFAHGYEALAGYGGTVLHGEAVAVGMVRAARLSAALGLAPNDDAARLERHIREVGLPTAPRSLRNDPFPVDAMIEVMRRDKKAEAGALRFVLWRGVGKAFLHKDVPTDTLMEILQADD